MWASSNDLWAVLKPTLIFFVDVASDVLISIKLVSEYVPDPAATYTLDLVLNCTLVLPFGLEN